MVYTAESVVLLLELHSISFVFWCSMFDVPTKIFIKLLSSLSYPIIIEVSGGACTPCAAGTTNADGGDNTKNGDTT